MGRAATAAEAISTHVGREIASSAPVGPPRDDRSGARDCFVGPVGPSSPSVIAGPRRRPKQSRSVITLPRGVARSDWPPQSMRPSDGEPSLELLLSPDGAHGVLVDLEPDQVSHPVPAGEGTANSRTMPCDPPPQVSRDPCVQYPPGGVCEYVNEEESPARHRVRCPRAVNCESIAEMDCFVVTFCHCEAATAAEAISAHVERRDCFVRPGGASSQ